MTETQRNMLILAAVAVAGAIFSGAFTGAAVSASTFLNIAFAVVIVWLGILQYRQRSGTIAQMPVMPRLVLQICALALLLIIVTGSLPLLPYPFGWSNVHTVLFYASILLCAFGIWWAWQKRTSRW